MAVNSYYDSMGKLEHVNLMRNSITQETRNVVSCGDKVRVILGWGKKKEGKRKKGELNYCPYETIVSFKFLLYALFYANMFPQLWRICGCALDMPTQGCFLNMNMPSHEDSCELSIEKI